MATQTANQGTTCLMCFESRPLKIVGKCRHSFCTECLTTVLESLGEGSEVFACPSCKVDCPRPWDGVNGLVDDTGDRDGAGGEEDPSILTREQEQETDTAGDIVKCDVCRHKDIVVKAKNFCSECSNLNICQECSVAHGRSRVTKTHLLTPVVPKSGKEEPMCQLHESLLIYHCLTCGQPVCSVCVAIEHSDHDVERLSDTIRGKVEAAKNELGTREERLTKLKRLKTQLTVLNDVAPAVDKQDAIIKDIEDHAQKCIDQIVKWKEDLKKEVRENYKIIRDIPECLEKVTVAVGTQAELVDRAAKLLSESEHHPGYLDELTSLLGDLEAAAGGVGEAWEEKGWGYRNELKKVHSENGSFEASQVQSSCGRFLKQPKAVDPTGTHMDMKEIFKHNFVVDSEDMFIPCIASLGQSSFAVAHPTRKGEAANAIDVYDYPGTFKRTLDNVFPVYDMASTPDGKLAVLSDGTTGTSRCVKVFDPETGDQLSSTQDIDVPKPLSLGVTLKHQYVILGENHKGQTQMLVTDKDGLLKQRCIRDELSEKFVLDDGAIDGNDREVGISIPDGYTGAKADTAGPPWRLTCGGNLIFVGRGRDITVYEMKDNGLQKLTSCAWQYMKGVIDINATIWGDVFITFITEALEDKIDHIFLIRNSCIMGKKTACTCSYSWPNISKYENIHADPKGADRETRVSSSDGRTVLVSHGQTIKVYKR